MTKDNKNNLFDQRVGLYLKALRVFIVQKNQAQLGKILNLDQAAISRIEAGTQGITLAQIKEYSNLSGVLLDDIISGNFQFDQKAKHNFSSGVEKYSKWNCPAIYALPILKNLRTKLDEIEILKLLNENKLFHLPFLSPASSIKKSDLKRLLMLFSIKNKAHGERLHKLSQDMNFDFYTSLYPHLAKRDSQNPPMQELLREKQLPSSGPFQADIDKSLKSFDGTTMDLFFNASRPPSPLNQDELEGFVNLEMGYHLLLFKEFINNFSSNNIQSSQVEFSKDGSTAFARLSVS